VAAWQDVVKEGGPEVRTRALYHLGLCHLHTEPADVSAAMAAWQEIDPECSDEAQAASLLLAELHLHKGEIDAALRELERALDKVKSADDYHNPLVPLSRVREFFELGQRQCMEGHLYDRGGPLMHLYRQVAEPGTAEERLGAIFETWAHELQSQPTPTNAADSAEQEKQIRNLFAQAGAAFKEVADVNTEAIEPLWRSGNCFFFAKAYKDAAEVLTRFLRSGKAGEREAEAWFALAEANQALKQFDPASQAYRKCMEFPGSSFAARACYQLAVQAIALSRDDEAEQILTHFVNGATGTRVEREVRRKALFTLGELLYKRLQFDKAEVHLANALGEYPNHPDALLVKDRLGDCKRRLAWNLYERERVGSISSKSSLHKQRLEKLEEAGRVYDALGDELRNRESSLSEAERLLLRKARYAVADCLYERELFVHALHRYADCAKSYAGTKEGLLAYEKVMGCYRNVGDGERGEVADTAAAAIHVTVVRFQDIPDSAFPFPNHTYTKQHWQRLLEDSCSTFRLDPPPWRQR
jgi:tetratricopeptide (TPR) repeat protein